MPTDPATYPQFYWKAMQDSWFPSCKGKEERKLYTFSKLEGERQIRIFAFETTEPSEDINIKIKNVSVDNLPSFECISYVWGDHSERRDIYYNKSVISITVNLWHALQRIRARSGKRRWFWADQITINQDDEKERSIQVSIMSSIYPRSRRVICWLGEEDEYSASAFDVLRKWARAEEDQNLRLQLGKMWSSDTGHKQDETLHLHQEKIALKSFFSREWFRRTWTLQEVFVPRKTSLVAVCGSYEISWHTVRKAFLTLCTTLSSADSIKVLGDNVRYILQMSNVYDERGRNTIRLSELLRTAVTRKASEPKDRIFALLGIMQQEQVSYPYPDYGLTEKQVFVKYTRAILAREGTLDILSYSQAWLPDDGMPSWVWSPAKADASSGPLLGPFGKSAYPSGGATGGTKPLTRTPTSPFDDQLQVCGLKIDRIERLCELGPFLRTISTPTKRWKDIIVDIKYLVRSLGLEPSYQRSGESSTVACMKTLVANDFYVGCTHPTRDYSTQTERLYHSYLRNGPKHMVSEAADAIAGAERFSETEWTEQSLYELARQMFHFEASGTDLQDVGTKVSTTTGFRAKAYVLPWLDVAIASDLAARMKQVVKALKLAVTTNGLLALVPGAADVGDQLCSLMGGFLPFLFRGADQDHTYTFVGEAYVHGYMDGRSAQECEALCTAAARNEGYPGLTKFCLI